MCYSCMAALVKPEGCHFACDLLDLLDRLSVLCMIKTRLLIEAQIKYRCIAADCKHLQLQGSMVGHHCQLLHVLSWESTEAANTVYTCVLCCKGSVV